MFLVHVKESIHFFELDTALQLKAKLADFILWKENVGVMINQLLNSV
jgi:hypothetical protein